MLVLSVNYHFEFSNGRIDGTCDGMIDIQSLKPTKFAEIKPNKFFQVIHFQIFQAWQISCKAIHLFLTELMFTCLFVIVDGQMGQHVSFVADIKVVSLYELKEIMAE